MDFDSVKEHLETLKEKLVNLKDAIKVNEKTQKIKELEKETLVEGFWNDSDKSSKILSEMKVLKNQVSKYDLAKKEYDDALTYLELAEEENDNDSFKEAKFISLKLEKRFRKA